MLGRATQRIGGTPRSGSCTSLSAANRWRATPSVEGEGMGSSLWTAFALMLVLEGLLPFLAPRVWRDAFRRIMELTDGQIRFVGLASMLAGIVLLLVVARLG